MNRITNKRWGKKLLLFLCVSISFLCIITIPTIYNDEMKAELAVADDGPLGEEIVDIVVGTEGNSVYALTKDGEVYSWGKNDSYQLGGGGERPNSSYPNYVLPKKVLSPEDDLEHTYLHNIKKIYAGGANGKRNANSGYAMAITNDNKLYAWGDNTYGNLGLPERIKYARPTLVPIDFKVDDIIAGIALPVLLSKNGQGYDAYTAGEVVLVYGHGVGMQGTGTIVSDTFQKITQDAEGNPMPAIKEVLPGGWKMHLIGMNGRIYATGESTNSGTNVSGNMYYPTIGVTSDGIPLDNVKRFITGGQYNGPALVETDHGIYVSADTNKNYFIPIEESSYYTEEYKTLLSNINNFDYFNYSDVYLANDDKLYSLNGYSIDNGLGFFSWTSDKIQPYAFPSGLLPADYNNAKKVTGDKYKRVLISNNGGVFYSASNIGKRVAFGDILLSGNKADGSKYIDKEKYLDNISISSNTLSGITSNILYDVTNLITNTVIKSNTLYENPIQINSKDSEHIYERYDFYLSDFVNNKVSFTVDLYKKTPTVSDIKNNEKYKMGKSFTISDNGFAGNTVSAKLQDSNGNIVDYISGTKITKLGNYKLLIEDQYGNKNDYLFTITDKPIAESIEFTPTDSIGLVYGNTITKAGSVIGTLSLVYAESDTPSTIKTLTIGIDQDGAKFEKSGTNQLKVKGTDLNAGTYVVPVSGTDQNDMPFSGEITIVIAKATSTMAWNNDTQSLSTDGLVLGKEITLGVKDQPSGTTVTYGMKVSNSCITLDTSTGKVKATCVPSPASVTFTATPAGNDNYNISALELTVPIKKQTATLNIELLDSDASYKNDVTIKIGDDLPEERIISTDPALDISTLGTPTYTYKKNNVEVSNPNIAEGIYTVSASYPSGSIADNYDITWNTATLRVEGITIDENNQSDYFTMTSDNKPYTQGTWTNKDIIITPIHSTFNQIDIDDAGNKSTNPYTYNVSGSKNVKLSFYNSDGAKVSTTVNLKYDKTAPVLSQFNYEAESSVRSFLRTVTFDHFFGKAQQLSFTGSDEANGSGLDHYRYEIVELDDLKNEKPASKKTGTLGLSDKLNLSINTSYRISAWAVDGARNESDEKIERVFLSDEVAQLNITATSDGKPYDGSTWTKSAVIVKLSSTSSAGVEKYQYSSDGVVFHDMVGDTITLPDPLANVDNVTYTFKAIHHDKTESDKTLNLKIDTVKPELNITGKVNGSAYDGSIVDQNIELTLNQTNSNISGATLYYTTSPTSKDTNPKTDSNWKRYTAPITHSANGTFTYYFKAISGAGISSEPKEYTVKLAKKEYTNITVNVTSEGKLYSPGNWAKGDVTFTLSGGLKDPTQITGYEYTATNGSVPSSSATWKSVTNKTLKLTENIKDQTYWFRVTPVDSAGKISTGTKVNLDVDIPTVPTMTLDEKNNTRVAQLINLISFGNWMNKQAQITMTSSDSTSGIDHYEYIETVNGTESQPKTSKGTLTYEDETELTLKARACDKAGNCSAYTNAEAVKIDMKAPTITGVKNQSEYKQYYLPRFVKVTDAGSGLKQATYKKDGSSAGTLTDNVETPIKGEGSYEIYAVDEAGNEVTLTFKIVKLPNIETEIDGSDESRDIIDQIIKELEEVKNKIDPNEKDNYEQWIKDAEEKWESLRKKVVEDDKTTSKVEGQGNTTFDPKVELIVEEIPKDKVPVLPRNAIKTYDVYLKKGNTVVQPDGSVKVYLPYTEEEPPVIYEINDDGTIIELPAQRENGFVTFITDTLKKYAISNEKQKENKPNVCVIGPDGKLDSQDDVCGEGNGSGVPPVKEEDGSVTVPDGGKVIFPDKEIDAPDGAIINPDGSVDFPDGTHYDPNGNETKKPDPTPNPDDGKNDQVCVAGPDGKLGTADDVCGEGNGTKDPDKGSDGSVTVPDGGSVIFPDGNEVELPDGGIIKPDGSVELPDGSTIDKDGNKKPKVCEIKDGVVLNKDSDGDGLPDLNLDIDNDCSPDLNIDFDNNGIPDFNIDSTGDGKADVNVDHDNDGFVDQNAIKLNQWIPNLNSKVNGFAYDTMSTDDIKTNSDEVKAPTTNDNQNGSTNNTSNGTDTKGNGTYHNNASVGGAGTGDTTKWTIWGILVALTLCTLSFTLYKKHKQK